jgi:SAM-dependent methyltransferase
MYASYAPIYEAIGQGAFAEELLTHILAAMPAPPRRALDLACGTGGVALALAAQGAHVVGVDRSPQMLAIACAKARDRQLPVTFVEADLRRMPVGAQKPATNDQSQPAARPHTPSFVLEPSSFDLVTCLYDSLNYLTGDDDLATILAAVAPLLRPGGRLIFDLNTEHEFASWDEGDQVVYDSGGLLVYNRLSYESVTGRAHGRIVWFIRGEDDRWWRGEEHHVERVWSEPDVLAALADAGLRLLARRTPSWEPALADAPRVVYEAEKL